MTDDLLARLDESLGAVREGRKPSALGAARPAYGTGVVSGLLKGTATGTVVRPAEASVAAARVSLRDRWPWVEWFVYLQFLWGALLFIPGSQAYRPIIRALPYASSAILLLLFLPQRSSWTKAPGSASFMLAALGVLVANLLHPTTQFMAGVAQCVFQLMIAAPVFWAWKAVRTEEHLLKIVRLVFLLNVLSAGVGALQVYVPDVFLPPQFSALGMQLSETWVDEMWYEGAGGRTIVRPPGLTDQPGAASVAGTIAAVLGLGLTLVSKRNPARVLCLGGAALGLFVLYLTQVRSLLLMCVAAFIVMAALMFRRGRFAARHVAADRRRRARAERVRLGGVGRRGPRRAAVHRDYPARRDADIPGEPRALPVVYARRAPRPVPVRRRRRPLGHDVHLLRRPDGSSRLRRSTSRFNRPGGCSMAASHCGCATAARFSPRLRPRGGCQHSDSRRPWRISPRSCCQCFSPSWAWASPRRFSIRRSGFSSGFWRHPSTEPAAGRAPPLAARHRVYGRRMTGRTPLVSSLRTADRETVNRSARVFGGVGLGQAHLVLVTLVGLWLTPVLLARVGQHRYGLWLVGLQLLGYLYPARSRRHRAAAA